MGLAPLSKSFRWALEGLLGLGLAALGVPSAEAAALTVPTSPGCATIQACVNTAAAGDTIRILPKTGAGKPDDAYYENVTVDKPTTITGTDRKEPERVTVDGAPAGDPGGIAFSVASNDVTIMCLRTRRGTHGISGVGFDNFRADRVVATSHNERGIDIAGNNFAIERATIGGIGSPADPLAEGEGIRVGGTGRVSQTTVRNARGHCFNLGGADLVVERNAARECGAKVSGFDDSKGFAIPAQNPRVRLNTARNAIDDGFEIVCVGACADGLVERNSADDNGDDGFVVRPFAGSAETAGLLLVGNTARRNGGAGGRVEGSGVELRSNRVEQNGTAEGLATSGIEVLGSFHLLVDNLSQRNQRDGFNIGGTSHVLRQNRAIQNRTDGSDVEGGTGNTLERNLADRNQGEGIENNAANTAVTDNVSRRNRIDCAASTPPAINTGNTCADGSNFAVPAEVEKQR